MFSMATHSSTLAWKIPWTEEPGGLVIHGVTKSQTRLRDFISLTSLTLLASYFYHWRRKWQPTPVFLPGESHGQRSLAGHGPWGRRESEGLK